MLFFLYGWWPKRALPVVGKYIRPNVYPRKSNSLLQGCSTLYSDSFSNGIEEFEGQRRTKDFLGRKSLNSCEATKSFGGCIEVIRTFPLAALNNPRSAARRRQTLPTAACPAVFHFRDCERCQLVSRHPHLHQGPSATADRAFKIRWNRPPAHTAIRYILQGLSPADVENVFRQHAADLNHAGSGPGTHVVAFDGKALKGSFDNFNDVKAKQVLSAFAANTALVLAHIEIDEKSNEIPAVQKLLEGVKGMAPKPGYVLSKAMLLLRQKRMGSLSLLSSVTHAACSSGCTAHHAASSVVFPWLSINSHWYAPVYGFLTTCCIWFLCAALRSRFAIVSGANIRVYEDLKGRFSELEARLEILNIHESQTEAKPLHNEDKDENDLYCREALRQVTNAKDDLDQSLFHNHSSTEWILGIGYINAWRIIHRAYEALVEFEPLQKVIGEVIHDLRSIQNSSVPDSKALTRTMLLISIRMVCGIR